MAEVNNSSWASGITDASAYQTQSSTAPQKDLDKNAFLNLLVTQMQYQDPLDPVDDKQFLAQMAQFSALEQMQNLNTSTSEMKANGLIGKYAISTSYNEVTGEYETTEGRVEGAKMISGEPYIIINDKEIKLSTVSETYEDYTELAKMNNIETALSISQNLALIGKNIEYNTYDDKGNVTATNQGVVEYVKFVSNGVILRVNGQDIYASQVVRVGEGAFTDTDTDTDTGNTTDTGTETDIEPGTETE